MRVVFIRHTRVAVEPGICYGHSNVDVAPTFTEEAKRVREKLAGVSFDAVYSSPLLRCRKLAAFCGYPSSFLDPRLQELHFGKWEMQKWDNINDSSIQQWYKDWIHIPAGGAESYEEQYHRVSRFLDELCQKDYRQVGIFTHRGVIACAMVYAGICTLENSFQPEVDYGSINTMELRK